MLNDVKGMNTFASDAAKGGALEKTPRRAAEDKGFLRRVCNALGATPRSLAMSLSVSEREVQDIIDVPAAKLADIDRHVVFAQLADMVDTRIAVLLAIRDEMQIKFDKDIKKRIALRERMRR